MNEATNYKIPFLKVILKITYGLLFVIAGIDKFFHFVTNWTQYLSPFVAKVLPFSVQHIMYGVGIVEIIIGILILTHWTKKGAYLAVGWLVLIIVNLLSMHAFYDIAVRDAVMAVGAYVLAQLSDD